MNLTNLKLLKKQNAKVQELIYKQYSTMIFNLVYRYVKREDVASELVNDTFIIVFRKAESFDDNTGKFSAWIKRIAINECLQYLRKQKAFETFEIVDELLEVDLNNTDLKLDLEHYYRLILALPETYRVVFNLYAIEGYSHKEIADKLNIAESTSRSCLLRARKQLQEKLEL